MCYRCGMLTRTRKIVINDVIPDHRDVPEGCAVPPGLERSGLASEGPAQASEEDEPAHRKVREVIISADAQIDLGRLSRTPPFTIPARFAMRVGATWAEALEGCLAGDIEWGTLAAYRTRLTLAPIPKGLDRIEELNESLD